MKSNTLYHKDKHFPNTLMQIPRPPDAIYYRGSNLFQEPRMIAIVGSRKPTSYGISITKYLATDLAKRGFIIVSGLALGIDQTAHKAALDAGGKTIAVLASGLDNIYPTTNQKLAKDIETTGGMLISEHEDGVPPQKYSFLSRNRIIAGISQAVIVTEAANSSGSLKTAKYALEFNKIVLAVPGPVFSPLSGGTNQLLATGAGLVRNYQDVLWHLNIDETTNNNTVDTASIFSNTSASQTKILKVLSTQNLDVDQLLSATGLDLAELQSELTSLELEDRINCPDGVHWHLKT